MIPYSTQHITLLDRIRVFRALGKPYLTQGPAVEEFEQAVASHVGAEHAVAVNSATSALHIACLALGLGPGDIMWTSSISFVASANCGLYCGAEVDFVDIDPLTFNMSPADLLAKLKTADKNGTLPKVIVVVHLAGESAQMDEVSSLARKYGAKIIEDASHALGSSYQGEKVGSGTLSDITVFSFHAVKNITMGEGGMAVTNDPYLARKMKLYRSHGIVRDSNSFKTNEAERTPWHYEQQELGFNLRLTDFQATLGNSQLTRLERLNNRRRSVLKKYKLELADESQIRFQKLDERSVSASHLAIIRVPASKRSSIVEKLSVSGFGTNLHYYPIHLQPYHFGRTRNLSESEKYAGEAISLPCHPGIRPAQIRQVSRVLREALATD